MGGLIHIRSAELVEVRLPFTIQPMFWAYILHCSDNSYYTGHTDDIDRRIAEHQSGAFKGYTWKRRPVSLVWSESFQTRDDAKRAEAQIKGWSRAKKAALITGDWDLVARLARSRSRGGVNLKP